MGRQYPSKFARGENKREGMMNPGRLCQCSQGTAERIKKTKERRGPENLPRRCWRTMANLVCELPSQQSVPDKNVPWRLGIRLQGPNPPVVPRGGDLDDLAVGCCEKLGEPDHIKCNRERD